MTIFFDARRILPKLTPYHSQVTAARSHFYWGGGPQCSYNPIDTLHEPRCVWFREYSLGVEVSKKQNKGRVGGCFFVRSVVHFALHVWKPSFGVRSEEFLHTN